MKKRIALCLAGSLALTLALAACGSPEPSESIREISLLSTEDGTAYYDVYLTDDVDWAKLTSGDQADIALYAINECRDRAAASGDDCTVIGYQDGVIAFSWGGVDGITKIRMYDEKGAFDYTWELSADDLNM